jgi:hypothetical protein
VLILQLLHLKFVLNRIVHLPVPSENVSRRGKEISKSCGDCPAAKTQESSIDHTTRLYGVQEAIRIYRRDLDNMPGSGREYLNPGGGGHGVHVFYQRDCVIGHRLAYTSDCAKLN